jgi:hypothetical protein
LFAKIGGARTGENFEHMVHVDRPLEARKSTALFAESQRVLQLTVGN